MKTMTLTRGDIPKNYGALVGLFMPRSAGGLCVLKSAYVSAFLESVPNRFLEKPFDLAQLESAVRSVAAN